MYMTEEEDRLLKEKGDLEASLMQTPTPIKPFKIRSSSDKASGGGGFGGGGQSSKQKKSRKIKKQNGDSSSSMPQEQQQQQDPAVVQQIINALEQDGIVRLDKVMSPQAADALREYLIDLRARSTAAIEEGLIHDSQERYADVLLNQARCDLKIPLGPEPLHQALLDVLMDGGKDQDVDTLYPSMVRSVFEGVFDKYQGRGKYASLWELNCFMSNSGARRQLVHADNVCLEPVAGLNDHEPVLLTCFIALQDIDASMGPTVWMPGTHTIEAHNRFFETGKDVSSTKTDGYSPKDDVMQSSKSVVGAPLPKGSCVIFDPRVLHCAGANVCDDPDKTRALFYMSFKNPKVSDPGCPSTSGYGIATAELTMEELVTDLVKERKGEPARHLALLASSP